MSFDKCWWFGHKWERVYICGWYGNERIKLIGTYCLRCFYGHDDLIDAIRKQDVPVFGTKVAHYYDEET